MFQSTEHKIDSFNESLSIIKNRNRLIERIESFKIYSENDFHRFFGPAPDYKTPVPERKNYSPCNSRKIWKTSTYTLFRRCELFDLKIRKTECDIEFLKICQQFTINDSFSFVNEIVPIPDNYILNLCIEKKYRELPVPHE